MHHSGDYIKIYDVNDNGMSTVITSLTGADTGPISYLEIHWSRWQKKIVSSTSNKMLVEFRSDISLENGGFSAFIHYSTLPSNQCKNGLDMTMKTFNSLYDFPTERWKFFYKLGLELRMPTTYWRY